MRMLIALLLASLFLLGCSYPTDRPLQLLATDPLVPAAPLSGQVAAGWRVQATMSEVASASTVSLIDTTTNQTVVTTLTDSNGHFSLRFPTTFHPDPGICYYLEAIKGLRSNAPGHQAARVRTVAKYQGGWSTLTNALPNEGIVLSPATTAVALGGALRGILDFTPLIGSITGSGFAPAAGLTATDFQALLSLTNQLLASDADPVAHLGLLSNAWIRLDRSLSLSSLGATSGTVGTTLAASGSGLALTPDNVVRFNGAPALAVASPDSEQLRVTVPSGATSGQTLITVGALTALGPLFTVLPRIDAISPRSGVAGDASGRTGSLVTLFGEGFGSAGTAELNGLSAPVVSWTNRSVTIAVPFGATSGPLSLTTGGNTAIGPAVSIVSNLAPDGDLEALAAGTDPTTPGDEGGGTTQSIVYSTTSRSGTHLLRFTSAVGTHRILFPGLTATRPVIVAGCWVRGNSSVNTWQNNGGILTGLGVIPVTARVWGTPWLTYYNPGSRYPFTLVPGGTSMTCYAQGQTWQYVQATASAQLGQDYRYGLALEETPWIDNGLMFDIDDVVLFESD